ncbi:hypothetical protein [Kitasatospora sp. NPDC001683]
MTPTADQLDHLIGHTANRALTPDEHALLRDGIRALRAILAGSLEATLSATLGRPSLGTYHQQVVKQLATAEDELGQWRRQGRRTERYRAAWQNARRRARQQHAIVERYRAEHLATLTTCAGQAEARIAAVRELHQPDGRQLGTRNDGAYGLVDPACAACGAEGMATPWPCPTIRALDGVTTDTAGNVTPLQFRQVGAPPTQLPAASIPQLADLYATITAQARVEAATREAGISAALTDAGFTVVRTQPVEQIAAEPATLGQLHKRLTSTLPSQLGRHPGQIGNLTGIPAIADSTLPTGEIHLRPHPKPAP